MVRDLLLCKSENYTVEAAEWKLKNRVANPNKGKREVKDDKEDFLRVSVKGLQRYATNDDVFFSFFFSFTEPK